MNPLLALIAALWTIAALGAAPAAYAPNVLPKGHDYFELRDGLANSRRTFEHTHAGRVVFLGGSITAGGAWRQHTWFRIEVLRNKVGSDLQNPSIRNFRA
jgi:hypothetical protein